MAQWIDCMVPAFGIERYINWLMEQRQKDRMLVNDTKMGNIDSKSFSL